MNNLNTIKDMLISVFTQYGIKIINAIPVIIIIIILLIIGLVLAKILSKISLKMLKTMKLDEIIEKQKLNHMVEKAGMNKGLSHAISKIVYYLVIIFVILIISESFGLNMISDKINAIFAFIPKFLTSIIIFVLGYLVANKIKVVIINVTASIGSGAGRLLGSIIFYFLMIMISITALDQLGIDTSLISTNVVMIIGIILLAGGLGYGLAAKDVMTNMLASFFSKKNFRIGQIIRVEEIEGEIIKIDNTTYTIQTAENYNVVIPSNKMISNKVVIIKDTSFKFLE